ncbi:DUF547 domain-containing protein [Nitrospinae bacterium AH_259_B05_G02_I21]|nr:DUF547 domain-containing protein [Nitrospinae bacterium AH_259_B05_G02_I21]
MKRHMARACGQALITTVFLISIGGAWIPAYAAGPNGDAFSTDGYAYVLKTYVNDRGMVNYKGLKADREKLDSYVRAMERLDRAVFERWSKSEQIAFWINAYNAIVLKTIIDNYPITPSFFKLAVFPRHSIWHISGVWDDIKHPIMGRPMSLNAIEHETLRKDFNEPRLHVSIVCAAISCPPLRDEPFTGKRLEAQLEDQARRFVANPHNFQIDRAARRVELSSIFKWFGEDFVATYGTDNTFNGHRPVVRAVLSFASRHLGAEDRRYLDTQQYSIHYTDYDWSLNEQRDGLGHETS